MRTYYDLFNLEKDADKQDIRRAFHRLAKQLHPDVSKDDGLFVEVLVAYKTIIDDEKRLAYNNRISDGGFRPPARVVCPACGGDRVHCNHCSYRGYVLKAVPVMVPIPTDLCHGAVFAFPLREIKNKRYAFFMVDTLYLKVMVLDR